MPDATILVVDDALIQARLMDQVLSKHFRVVLAGNGEEALAAARAEAPDLILLDIQMPGMDGFAVFCALQADPATRGIPVVFITARDTEPDEVQGLEAGGVDYIIKPCPARVLLARVRTHLEFKRSRDRLAASEARYRALFLHSPQPVAVWRREGDTFVLEEHNLAAARLCQRITGDPGDAPGPHRPELPGLEQALAQCQGTGKDSRLEMDVADAEGRALRLVVQLACIPPDTVLMVCSKADAEPAA